MAYLTTTSLAGLYDDLSLHPGVYPAVVLVHSWYREGRVECAARLYQLRREGVRSAGHGLRHYRMVCGVVVVPKYRAVDPDHDGGVAWEEP